MQELIHLREAALVELRLWELFPAAYTHSIHSLIPRETVLGWVVDDLGLKQATEADVTEYALATRQDGRHWPYGEGRRFLMAPIIRKEKGETVTYRGPYPDCGTKGYELRLWRTKTEEDPARARFPQMVRHPTQIAYPVLRTLIAKKST